MKVAAYKNSYYEEETNSVVLMPVTKSLVSLENKNDISAMEVNTSVNHIIEKFFLLKKKDKDIIVIFGDKQSIMNIKYYPKKDMYKFKITSVKKSEKPFWEEFKKRYKLEYQISKVSIEEFVANFGIRFSALENEKYEISFVNNNEVETYELKDSNPKFADTKFKNSSSRNNSEITSIKKFFESIKEEIIIPHYQRDYMWEERQVNQLMSDLFYTIELNIKGVKYNHFLGNIVLTTSDEANLSLVDGQQRLTTFMLLFNAINEQYGNESNELMNIIYTHESKLKLNQKKYIRNTIEEQFDSNEKETIDNKISINTNIMRKTIKESTYTYSEILKYGLNKMSIQKLILPSEYDENTVFETLNARGLELSNYDLIKAFLFAFDEYNEHITDYETHIENKNNTNITINEHKMMDLFRDYLAMKAGELYSKSRVDTKQKTLYTGFKDYIKKEYEKTRVTRNIYEKEYKSLFEFKEAGERLESLKNKYFEIVPLQKYNKECNALLKTLCYVEKSESRLHDGLNEYSKYIVRKCLLNKQRVSWEHAKTAHHIFKKHTNSFCSSEILKELKEKKLYIFKTDLPNDKKIIERAMSLDYKNSSAVFLHCMLESKIDRPGASYTFEKVSAEHIYPQNPAGVVNEEALKVVDRLGNYCLLDGKSNSIQQNLNFKEKLNKKLYESSAYYYTSKLQSKAEYKLLDEFNEQAILSRSDEIIRAILERY